MIGETIAITLAQIIIEHALTIFGIDEKAKSWLGQERIHHQFGVALEHAYTATVKPPFAWAEQAYFNDELFKGPAKFVLAKFIVRYYPQMADELRDAWAASAHIHDTSQFLAVTQKFQQLMTNELRFQEAFGAWWSAYYEEQHSKNQLRELEEIKDRIPLVVVEKAIDRYLSSLESQLDSYLEKDFRPALTSIPLNTRDAVSPPNALESFSRSIFDVKTMSLATGNEYPDLETGFAAHDYRVLLLGEPGAGKTVTLAVYARSAIARYRNHKQSEPIPIVASLKSWSGKTSILKWLGIETSLGETIVERTINEGRALIILDGLDEISVSQLDSFQERDIYNDSFVEEAHDRRITFMDALSELPQHLAKIVISCRISDYKAIFQLSGRRLVLEGALTLQRLTEQQIELYLQPQPKLWEIIRDDSDLMELVSTPLMLWMFAEAYEGIEDKAREDMLGLVDSKQLNDQLFTKFVANRYEFEERKRNVPGQHRQIPSLEEFYLVLGKATLQSTAEVDMWETKGTDILTKDILAGIVGPQLDEFLNIAEAMKLLRYHSDQQYEFSHHLLRTHMVLPYLERCLFKDNPNTKERRSAARALGLLGDPRVIPSLSSGLKHDPDIMVQRFCATGLGYSSSIDAISPLIDALEQNINPYVKRAIIISLGYLAQFDSERIMQALIPYALDQNPELQVKAINGLGHLPDTRVISILIGSLTSKSERVRAAAVRGLGFLQDSSAVQPLLDLIANQFTYNDRLLAVKAFGYMRDARALPILRNVANNKLDSPAIRIAALYSLRHYLDVETIPVYENLLQDPNSDINITAVEFLGGYASEGILPSTDEDIARIVGKIVDITQRPNANADLQCASAGALGQLRAPVAVLLLLGLLTSNDLRTRLNAAGSLGDYTDERCIVPLIATLGAQETTFVKRCRFALQRQNTNLVLEELEHVIDQGSDYLRTKLTYLDTVCVSRLVQLFENPGTIGVLMKYKDKKERAKNKKHIPPEITELDFTELIERLHDQDATIRLQICRCFEIRRSREAIPYLLTVLQTDDDALVRGTAASALGEMHAQEAVQPIIDALVYTTEDALLKRFARVLGQIGDRRAILPLIGLLSFNSIEVQQYTISALAKFERSVGTTWSEIDKIALAIAPFLDHESIWVRFQAALALGKLKSHTGIMPLRSHLGEPDNRVRKTIRKALMNLLPSSDGINSEPSRDVGQLLADG